MNQYLNHGNVLYGIFDQQMQTKCTIKKLIDDWNCEVNYIHNSETTWKYNENLQRHILAYFCEDKLIETLDTTEVIQYFHYLKNVKQFCNNTINKHRTHLMTLFEFAICNDERYGLQINPIRKIRPLRHEPYAYTIYSPDECKRMMKILHESGNLALEAAVGLALYCGCRREEVCGLKWNNTDLDRKVITIAEVRTIAGNQIVHHKYTKNNTIRVIGIPDALYKILIELQHYQQMHHQTCHKKSFEYVLCEDNGEPWHPSNVTMRWRSFLEHHHLRMIRFHDLRHTNLSLLMTQMSAVDVAKIGGHAKVSTTTNIYGHSFTDIVERGKDIINHLL